MRKSVSVITIMVFMMIGLSMQTFAAQEMSAKKVQRLDRKMTKKSALKKRFRTQKEYMNMKKRGKHVKRRVNTSKRVSPHRRAADVFGMPRKKIVQDRYVEENIWYGDDWNYPRGPRQRSYRNFKRGWYLAYRYDRATFYDRYGYEYGYFNNHGYYFDGIFYGYDRYYRYQDRLRGRGLFDGRYYMPANADRYGFCKSKQRSYPKPFRR